MMGDLDYEGAAAEDSRERMDVTIMGRRIGTASGWDVPVDHMLCFYDFVPEPGVPIQSDVTLAVCFDSGTFETYNDDNGEVVWSADAVPILMTLPRIA